MGAFMQEPESDAAPHWHFRPGSMGKAVILGEIGSHLHHLSEFVTAQEVTDVSADLAAVAPGRLVYDNAYLNVSFSGGARGRLWSSYVAAGEENGLKLRIFGTKGSLRWVQEFPEELWLRRPDLGDTRLTRGSLDLSAAAANATRVPPGHPEGYLLAFATLYREFFTGVIQTLLGEDPSAATSLLPGAEDGVRTLRLIHSAERSHELGERQPVTPDLIPRLQGEYQAAHL